MKRVLLLCMVFLLGSCELFQSKETRTENKVQQELLAIDWNDVDQYPLFDECDETASKVAQRTCFQQEMLSRFTDTLSSLELTLEKDLNDTLKVDFLIDEDGFITILEIQENNIIQDAFPDLKEEVSMRLNDLTTVAPALKRGIPVSLKFRLPIVLNNTN